uniref:Uncharacterized protein n=1 Tax=Oryza punctata TaxID=4537 RepID=A0A0E0M560_ORYPU
MEAMQPAREVFIRRVTADNLAVEMLSIRSHLPDFPYITIHADYPVEDTAAARHGRRRRRRGGRGNKRESLAEERCYKLAKARVDELHVLQLGITLCDHHGRLPATVIAGPGGLASAVEMAWQVGFSDFDVLRSSHNQSAVDALRAAGVDLEHLRARGVPAAVFGQALREFNIVSAGNRGRLTWVAFGGIYDFGFLLKMLDGGRPLPQTSEGFVSRLRGHLGVVYDAKYVAARLPVDGVELRGGLVRVARLLGAPAAAVEEPRQAGEKSLVASQVFMRMTGLFFAYHDVAVHAGKIDGLQ